MFRPTSSRLAQSVASTRTVALRQQRRAPRSIRTFADVAPKPTTPPPPPPPPPAPASQPASNNTAMWIVLGAIVALGGGGYYLLKPVADVASITHQAIGSAKNAASGLGDSADSLSGVVKSFLPPGAFALYSAVSKSDGGMSGFLSSLKDKDLQGVIDEVKKHGGDEVKSVIEKVEKKVKQANGKVQDVDWLGLAQELKEELPKDKQHIVDTLVGKLPGKEDVDKYIKQLKDVGQDQLKEVESAANKVLKQVEKAKKDGKLQGDAFLKALKDAAPGDIDSLVQQLKDAAKKAGLPADMAESWLKSKAEDKKGDAEEIGKQVTEKLRVGAKYLPGEPKDLLNSVAQVSPSLSKLLAQALVQAGVTDEQGNRKKA